MARWNQTMTAGDPIGGRELPRSAKLVRTTSAFTEDTVPRALLSEHHIAADVWGRLVVLEGSLTFCFDDGSDHCEEVGVGDRVVIPPVVMHHVQIDGPVRFVIEFYR